jgi:hypothetical protein
MSHTVEIKTELTNLEATKNAFNKLNWKVVENQKKNTYSSDPDRNTLYDNVAKNPSGGYDVGITTKGGTISFHCDFHDGGIVRGLGKDFSLLKTQYTLSVLELEYAEVAVTEDNADYLMIEADDGQG